MAEISALEALCARSRPIRGVMQGVLERVAQAEKVVSPQMKCISLPDLPCFSTLHLAAYMMHELGPLADIFKP